MFQRFRASGFLRNVTAALGSIRTQLERRVMGILGRVPADPDQPDYEGIVESVRRHMVAGGIAQISTERYFINHQRYDAPLNQLRLLEDQYITYYVTLIGPNGTPVTVQVKSSFKTPLTEDQFTRALRSSVHSETGDVVAGENIGVSRFVDLARIVVIPYISTVTRR